MEEKRKVGTFEQRSQTVLMAVVTALVLWVGATLLDIRDRITKLEISSRAEVLALSLEVERLKGLVDPRDRFPNHRSRGP